MKFFYEHLGHMQFSTLTLEVYKAFELMSGLVPNSYVTGSAVIDYLINKGYSIRQAEGEIDRLCYGYEIIQNPDKQGKERIALTELGLHYINSMLDYSELQSSYIAILVRSARRKKCLNITVQESTFFNERVYKTISDFGLRKGPCRDFLKCLTTDNLIQFVADVSQGLNVCRETGDKSIDNCIGLVEKSGKFWKSIGGTYSWFVFPQMYELSLSESEWEKYCKLKELLIRPPEWGGGKWVKERKILEISGDQKGITNFRTNGIIRPNYLDGSKNAPYYAMTAPGYLMLERKQKGFINELGLKRIGCNKYELMMCDASDFMSSKRLLNIGFMRTEAIPTWIFHGGINEILTALSELFYGPQLEF